MVQGALCILAVFRGRANQPANRGGGGFQSLPTTQPQLGAAPYDSLTLIKTEYWDRAGGGGNISYDW